MCQVHGPLQVASCHYGARGEAITAHLCCLQRCICGGLLQNRGNAACALTPAQLHGIVQQCRLVHADELRGGPGTRIALRCIQSTRQDEQKDAKLQGCRHHRQMFKLLKTL